MSQEFAASKIVPPADRDRSAARCGDAMGQEATVASTGTVEVLRRIRVLVVEDNPAEAELIFEWLSSSCGGRLDITLALDMTRALRACDDREFDALVLDLQLPDAMGADTMRSMRTRCPRAAIIAYSGMDNEASRLAALRAGADDFISKNEADAATLSCCVLLAIARRERPLR
jgi:CheY-like chemotaxis protein